MPLPGDNYYPTRNNLFSKMNTFCFRFANVQFSKTKQELPVFWYTPSNLFHARWSKLGKIELSEFALGAYFIGIKIFLLDVQINKLDLFCGPDYITYSLALIWNFTSCHEGQGVKICKTSHVLPRDSALIKTP